MSLPGGILIERRADGRILVDGLLPGNEDDVTADAITKAAETAGREAEETATAAPNRHLHPDTNPMIPTYEAEDKE